MSVAGRNMVNGSTVTVYRATKTAGTGGQTSISWTPVYESVKWELHTRIAETLRQVFGTSDDIHRTVIVSDPQASIDVRMQDAIVVTSGRYSGEKYRVGKTIRSRKNLELALKLSTETIP